MEPQKTAPPEHRYHIGMRIVKTVTAVFLCGLLAWARSASAFYSMIAAVVCVQNSAGKTIEASVNRMVGTLIGFTALIPVAGAYIGAGVGAFMIFTVSPLKALLFLVFISVLQQLEGNLIYPKVVGSSIGLPGIWVLAAVTIGGGVLGIGGMLLAVPLAATFYQILRDDVVRRNQ